MTGPPGTGLSTIVNQLIAKLENNNKTFTCLCSLNFSALIIKGQSIHKFLTKIKVMESIYILKYDYLFEDKVLFKNSYLKLNQISNLLSLEITTNQR